MKFQTQKRETKANYNYQTLKFSPPKDVDPAKREVFF